MNGTGNANRQESSDGLNIRPSQVAVLTATVLVVIGIALALVRLIDVMLLLFLGLVIAATLQPLVNGLQRQGLPKSLAVVLIYLATLGVIIGLLVLVAPALISQGGTLASTLPQRYTDLANMLKNSPSPSIRSLADRLPPVDQLTARISASGADFVTPVLGFGVGLIDFITRMLAVLVIGYYLTMDQPRLERFWLSLAPPAKRARLLAVWREIEQRLGSFVRGELLLMSSIGALAAIGYVFIGLPYALALGALAGLLEAVPLLGPSLGAIPALIVALSVSPKTALLVAGWTALVQVSENNIIAPRLLGHSVGVSPVVVILAIFAFGSLLGIGGAFLAIPLAAIFQVLMDQLIVQANVANTEEQIDASAGAISQMRAQIHKLRADVMKRMRNREGFVELSEESVDAVENQVDQILNRVDAVLSEAEQTKQAAEGQVHPEVIAQVDEAIDQVNELLEQARTINPKKAEGVEQIADQHLDKLVQQVDQVGQLIEETKAEVDSRSTDGSPTNGSSGDAVSTPNQDRRS